MTTEFRKAVLPRELRSLVRFDRKIFSIADRFNGSDWKEYESYWLLVDGKKVGCCAFEARDRSLYIATTGILPQYQRLGFGDLMKSWQVTYARQHGFARIVTNTRKRNAAMIGLNKKHGFKAIRTVSGYYKDPPDSTVVMELVLRQSRD